MTDEEKLAAMSKALAAAENDPLQPACVMRAFLSESVHLGNIPLHPLTLRGHLQLESARSPFVTGEFPNDGEAALQALCIAVSVLAQRDVTRQELIESLTPQEAAEAEIVVARIINAAWETALPMRRVEKAGEKSSPLSRDHGFGWWVRVLTKLIVDLGFTRDEALDCPMAQAFALVATTAVLDGDKEPAEMNWREKEAMKLFGNPDGGPVAKEPEDQCGNDERSGGADRDTPGNASAQSSTPNVVGTGNQEADRGAHN